MDRSFYANCLKAARAGLTTYTDAENWAAAMDWHAKAKAKPGESFVDLLDHDRDMRALDKMRRATRGSGGRPRSYQPSEITRSAAEAELAKRATDRARRDGTGFEVAFVAEIETPEGAELLRRSRR
jgi:hypothetical protein